MKNALFEMVKYHNKEYPMDIPLHCEEISAHFDVVGINPEMENYSLYTEYSYGKRNFNGENLLGLFSIISANKYGVPQLWKDEQWSREFAEYLFRLIGENKKPSVIEIHPPFSDYTENLTEFINRYLVFEKIITEQYPSAEILIENRCGSVYQGGRFCLSKLDSIIELSDLIDKNSLKLRFALDVPQLYTAHNVTSKNINICFDLLRSLISVRHNVGGVHLWGKRKTETGRIVAHCGDLNSYFGNDKKVINEFCNYFTELFADNIKRKMVLEVNSSNEDLLSIIDDLKKSKVLFV